MMEQWVTAAFWDLECLQWSQSN